jgi:nucleoside-diphosphate-sugar epimerase
MTQRALVIGARGQIGRFLLPRLKQDGWSVSATTRDLPPTDSDGLKWYRFDVFGEQDLVPEVDTVFGLGPLDGLAQWLARSALRPRRLVAFGSTSASTKQDSIDAHERDVAERLRRAEKSLQAWARRNAVDLTVLRPTLIYGAGMDRNLTRLVRFAQNWGFLPLPGDATGLRQPVHAEDLAMVAAAAAGRFRLAQTVYDLPGGETIVYREMVMRLLACLDPPRRVITVPKSVLRLMLQAARRLGRLHDASDAMLARLHQDLVFDATPARRDLGFEPRAFIPHSGMFVSSETGR